MNIRIKVMCEPIAGVQPDMCQPESALSSEVNLTACFELLIGMRWRGAGELAGDQVLLFQQGRGIVEAQRDNDRSMCKGDFGVTPPHVSHMAHTFDWHLDQLPFPITYTRAHELISSAGIRT